MFSNNNNNNYRMQKKTKRMTEIKVLTKDFTSYKMRYKSLRKRK